MDTLPLDITLYKILTDPDLTPPDVLGLCRQPGFVLLCRLPKVGRALMRRYYPNIPIDPISPWTQFRVFASKYEIHYQAELEFGDGEESHQMIPINEIVRTEERSYDKIKVTVRGVPIGGRHWIGGHNHNNFPEYTVYPDRDAAIQALWDMFDQIIENDSSEDPARKQADEGVIDYSEPVDYPSSFEKFKQNLIDNGHVVYHYFRHHEHNQYGDFSDYGYTVFSIHNPVFVN